jgi:small-conductance mechanosensitive channel
MRQPYWKTLFFTFSLILVFYLLMPSFQVIAKDLKTGESELPAEQPAPADVDAYLAGLSDTQVRQVLAQKLKQETDKQAAKTQGSQKRARWSDIGPTFHRAAQGAANAFKRVSSFFSEKDDDSKPWGQIAFKLTGGKGAMQLLWTLLGVALIIAAGLVLKRLFQRSTADIRKNILQAVRLGKLQFFVRVLSRLLLDALGISVYVLVTFALFVLIYKQGKPSYIIASTYFVISYYVILIAFAAKIILAPQASSLRLFPMADVDASFLYKWLLGISIMAALVAGTSRVLDKLGITRQIYLEIYSMSGAVVIVALLVMIWQSRHRVAAAIRPAESDGGEEKGSLRAALARNWHYFAYLYALVVGGLWIAKVLNDEDVSVLNLIFSIFLIPLFIGIDQWVQRLLKIASGELPETFDLSGEEPSESAESQKTESKMAVKHYVPFIKRSFRIVLIAFLFFVSLRLWGIDLSVGRIFTRDALSIVVVILLGFITWEIIKARIDRKLKEEMPDQDEDMEEGGAGGSRTGTLLLLLRKFVLAVMFVIVSLIVLSSLGINIGPLIAGAGVIGLAIGFGAQTLVKDIISGIFFLIDDAFRVGDYVETAGCKGMVEQISLRSLKLRHPRGMVYTIPFGGMGTMTNFSRDYIITKLDIRVRYDTDVEKVRKIVKNINKAIMKDEEMGPVMLDKIKSQGVREMDDSAMIMRVKFKTIPGEQFVVRREVYRLIQEEFRANGIEFAHRNVTVYLPPEEAGSESGEEGDTAAAGKADPKLIQAGAAAAIAAAQEDKAKKKPK